MNDLTILSVRSKTRRIGGTAEDAHPKNILVEEKRAIEVRDLQTHSAQMRRFGKTIAFRTNSLLFASSGRHLLRCHIRLHSAESGGKCYA
jgi:hypothetical protein